MGIVRKMKRYIVFFLLIFPGFAGWALPQRLVIALDGVAWRDLAALQNGAADTNFWGSVRRRRAFTAEEGYFPVSRLISTFPSTSDVAWTDIFGDRPLPGYQRTYFSDAANSEISMNGLTSTVEHERQMDYDTGNNFTRAMGYIYSAHVFRHELDEMIKSFLATRSTNANYYVYIRSSDDAQHMDRDILSLLSIMDGDLQDLRARYRAREGHDLQILVLSDHGHNHAGRGRRVLVGRYLERAGYHVGESIRGPKDVVLPTSGIEDWIEVHNAPEDTEKIAEALTHLKGADVVTARLSNHRFLVLNSTGEKAFIEWNPANNSFRYEAAKGDPLRYCPVVAALARNGRLDHGGFAASDDWMDATMTNHYPLALERIVRGLTCVTLNPATILVSLDNHYVNAGWLVNEGSMMESCGSTHGALDDINSTGILLSNFQPTHDTSTARVAGLFDDFPGLRDYRAQESGAEWIVRREQAATRIPRDSLDWNYKSLPAGQVFLRVWSPRLASAGNDEPLETTIERLSGPVVDPPGDPATLQPEVTRGLPVAFAPGVSLPQKNPFERIYGCPRQLALEPGSAYLISGWIRAGTEKVGLFEFTFRTDEHGRPVAY